MYGLEFNGKLYNDSNVASSGPEAKTSGYWLLNNYRQWLHAKKNPVPPDRTYGNIKQMSMSAKANMENNTRPRAVIAYGHLL